MNEYIGLDVSMKETAISVRRDGKRIWRGKCPSDPKLLAEVIREHAPNARRVVFETGPLSVWFYHGLSSEGLPAICIDARHAKAALDMAPNKTDANDADGLAHLAEVGFYREVRVKGYDSMLIRTLVTARTRLIRIATELSNQIRGLMKTFGLVVPKGGGLVFETNVRNLLGSNAGLERIILPLLEAWHNIRSRAAQLDRQLIAAIRQSDACRVLMSIPGIGTVTSASFVATIEDPKNFRTSRSVGAWLGLTTRRYQSGEVDYGGHISRRGDSHLRGLLYEAATVILTRAHADSSLRAWGMKLREKVGFKRAAVAVARKLSVIMHRMLITGEIFDRSAGMTA
ncbi:IS110 family transposase (plasmid) [Rhizobium sp. B230/85]|uniref:IS110 family transposase n=1 Tax=unclassified Rhizobium TaxID=2613769 RepID=UPI001ADA774B|nr:MULTISPECIES: IS110 family transposase [unclassified Rhizobium]MBO9136982.1 IS110 family transposase [Rhizobium sp. B209b/85]QXZ99618.1 IS110 family transposase [Rhizobium sp. B230/85]